MKSIARNHHQNMKLIRSLSLASTLSVVLIFFPEIGIGQAVRQGAPPGAVPGGPPGAMKTIVSPDGKKIQIPAEAPVPEGFKVEGGDAKPEEKKDGKPAEGAQENIKRKTEPPEPPNKREFDVKPDDQGMVQFQFRNQGWPDLMRWLAEVSSMSLDWQELPGDYLNLATQRKYSLDETRDLFNYHLLARGFTILESDGILHVVKTAGINSALVPKVKDPSTLESLPPHRFVRVSFPLRTLIASDVIPELKPLVSNNGSLNALTTTNRLEAMDTASNLAELYRVLEEEQSDKAVNQLAQEFPLEFVRASDVRTQLGIFLGIESPKSGRDTSENNPMMMQQQMMMMQQQMQQQMQAGANAGAKSNDIYLVADNRRNCIIASARPNKMAVIAAFIRRIDVPNDNANSMSKLVARMKVYRLTSLDPKQLVSSLQAMDALEPTSRLEVDEKNNAIIAYASIADHLVIQRTIERLDGSARDFDVIQLRRLKAEDVAGTIRFLMGVDDKKEESPRRRSYFFYDPWGNNDDKKKNNDAFRVGANVQDNQVLLWANEVERNEVNKLLVKLGELPPEGGNRSRMRIIDANRSSETREYLKRLQESWNKISPNPLVLPDDDDFEPPDAKRMPGKANDPKLDEVPEEEDAKSKKKEGRDKDSLKDTTLRRELIPRGFLSSTMGQSQPPNPSAEDDETVVRNDIPNIRNDGSYAAESDESTMVEPRSRGSKDTSPTRTGKPTASMGKSSIQLSFDERGNLVLTSDDFEALDRLEQMMVQNAPPTRNHEVFYIKHARPSWIKWNLEDYYKEDKKSNNQDSVYRWLFDMDQPSEKKDDPQLGKKRKLKFLSDNDTNTLLVVGADDVQLKTIEGLIRLWDVPEKKNKQKLRFTKLVHVDYSKAESIVEAIKDAYRDLLSANDKAFKKEEAAGGGGGAGGEGSKDSKRSGSSDSIYDGGMSFNFSGLLSLGVDKVTNSIIVSAEGQDLLELVIDMITQLDEAARPNGTVQVLKLGGSNPNAMERALRALMKGAPSDNGQQPQNPANGGNENRQNPAQAQNQIQFQQQNRRNP